MVQNIKDEKLIEIIKEFENTLNVKLKHCNLNLFKKNIASLNIKKAFRFAQTSTYDVKKNIIKLIYIEDLEHELMHVASSYYLDKKSYSGFSVNMFCDGLNEGYTQVLCNRYFEKDKFTYPVETKIALNVEKIIGKEKMEQIYFEANQLILICELKKYLDEEKVLNLIELIDILCEQISYKEKNIKKNQCLLQDVLKKINLYLLEGYTEKLILDYKNETINKKQLFIRLKSYIKDLKFALDPYNNRLLILNKEDIEKNIKLLNITM